MELLLEVFVFSIPMIILSWVLPRRFVLLSQVMITAAFIGYQSPVSLLILASVSFGNYYLLHKSNFSNPVKISISLVILIFLIASAKLLFSVYNHWIIPLGMSYYIFRNIHYTIEYFKGKIQNEQLLYYLAYNFFLPVIIVGPINRYHEFVKDWQRRRFNSDYASLGIQRILYGMSKIVIIGNYLLTAKVTAFIGNLDAGHTWLKAYLETIELVLNAYFQFAGYSDIAIGISLLLGYRIMENFNYPFLASNMQEFWSKYHMSLSAFCRDYIYTPIASYYRRPLLGIIATMIIIGLWHEISFSFLIWGVLQAVGIILSSFFKGGSDSFLKKNMGRIFVLNYFSLSSVVVHYDTLADALHVYKILFFIH